MTVTAGAADLPGIKSQTATATNTDTAATDLLDSPEAVQSMVSRLSDKEVRGGEGGGTGSLIFPVTG